MKILKAEKGYDYFAPLYNKQYEHLDSFDWNLIKEILFSKIDLFFNKESDIIKIGDFGCGDGRILKRVCNYLKEKNYLNFQIFGIDISEKMIKTANKKIKNNVKLIKLDLEREKPDEIFDIIYSFFLLVHIKDVDNFFSNVKNNLNDGGIFIFNNIEQKKGFQLPFFKEETYIEFFNHSDNKIYDFLVKYFSNVEKIKSQFSTIFICQK
jgi:2-polyprenyl-3-methyl-5-hydroxy-6-metoxy-1,4-benzoquinol methylase